MQTVFHISLIAEKFKCYEADLEERKSQQLLGTEFRYLARLTSVLSLSYDNQTMASSHTPLHCLGGTNTYM